MVARIWWAREHKHAVQDTARYFQVYIFFHLSQKQQSRGSPKTMPRKVVGLFLIRRELPCAINVTIYPARAKLCVINKKAVIWSVRYYKIDALYYTSHDLVRPLLLLSAVAGCVSILKVACSKQDMLVRLPLKGPDLNQAAAFVGKLQGSLLAALS